LVGFLGVPEALGGTNLFAQWLAPSFSGEAGNTHDLSRVLEYLLMAASVAVALGGIAVAYRMFLHKPFTSSKPTPVTTALLEALYIDKIYDRILLSPITVFSRNVLHAIIDVKVIDGFINGLAWIAALGGRNVRLLQTGSVRTGLYYIVAGVAVSMLIIFLRSQ
jgi:NADH-quinone oxidoreductase subunit L